MKRFYCFTHSVILISLLQQNFRIRKCSWEANSVYAHAWRTFLSFALSILLNSMRRAKVLPRPILCESDWNWNLKFGFLGQYGQNTIFQTNGRKIQISFSHKIFEKKILQNIYMVFSQVFSSRSFTWALL